MQEESLELENSIQHRVTKEDVDESIREYLGEYVNVLREISLKEYEIFTQLLPKVQRIAYFVKGNQQILKKFKAYFIARCVLERYDYSSIMLKDYIEGITDKNSDELFIAGISRSLIFLYLHGEVSGLGNTDNWMGAATLDKMVNRKREGLITVLLSERDFPQVENSPEVKVVNLGGALAAIKTEGALQNIRAREEKSSSKSTSKYE